MNPLFLLPPLAVTVFFLIRAELKKDYPRIYFWKPVSTLLVIAAALFALPVSVFPGYFNLGIIIGLALSLGGDICLMFYGNERAFMIGLLLFLLAHISYTLVFTIIGVFSYIDLVSAVVLVCIGAWFYRKMLPRLGSMKIPVLVYLFIISFMVNRAVALTGSEGMPLRPALFLSIGAGLFFLSDWYLAYDKFVKSFIRARISVAFYYAGQILIALSLSQ